ncbi:MAG: bifunctional metallophosphatase/5'-nucleotidase [Clostridiales bacterium]|nr:bifunctional metallophosphatase/5'-nucleotidase [Clostridiales bacterium]
MKKFLVKISSLVLAVFVLCTGLVGCDLEGLFNGLMSPEGDVTKLDVPEVTISVDGVAVWSEVDYALGYMYVIDNGEEILTARRTVQLQENQTIKVKAVSGDKEHEDSDFSVPKKYVKASVGDHTHLDVDDNGICDVCSESVLVELSFYAVNDLHGKFMDTATQPGLDEFTTYIKDLYADDAREEILLSSGDMWQGTVESSSNKGQLMTDWMNEVGFVSMTLGNHEYDWGADVLTPNSEKADFPFLAINITSNGKPVNYCQPSTVVERGGVKIGIIGAIGDCLSSISGDFSKGLKFATGSALTSLVKSEATRLRNEEGCDFIVYSIHDGGSGFSSSGVNSVIDGDMSWYDSSLSNGYVDLVFEGHTHQRYILEDEYGVYHMQGGGENSYISSAAVSYNTVTSHYTVSPRLIYKNEYASSSITGDPVVEEIFNRYFPDGNPYTTVLGTNRSKRYSDTICDKVAELYYNKGKEVWGNQYDIVLGGGYLNTRSPYDIAAGKIYYADLFSVLPFDNEIVLGQISGYYLKSKFLESTNSNYHIYSTITSSQVENNKQYYIIVDSYSSTYSYNHITEIKRLGSGIYARDLLAEFVKAGGWA